MRTDNSSTSRDFTSIRSCDLETMNFNSLLVAVAWERTGCCVLQSLNQNVKTPVRSRVVVCNPEDSSLWDKTANLFGEMDLDGWLRLAWFNE